MFLVLTRCKTPDSDDELDPGNLDDDEFGDVDLEEIEEEEELELIASVYPGRSKKPNSTKMVSEHGRLCW